MAGRALFLAALVAVAALAGCAPEPLPVPPGGFAFAALGDAPYLRVEEVRFERLIDQLNAEELAWVLHVGDTLWYPCSEEKYRARLATFERIRHPFLLTPGDNEWSDCWERIAGGYRPLDRLAKLRRVFFADPATSVYRRLLVESQETDPEHAEFVENIRWRHEGVLSATLHMVGGRNAGESFPGRTAADDIAAARRMAAAIAWMRATFARARAEESAAVVLAMHAAPALESPLDDPYRLAYRPLMDAIAEEATRWARPVLLIHGDHHEYTVDRPLTDADGTPVENLTRLQVPGSPEIGWVRVIVSPGDPEPFRFDRRRVRRWVTDLFRRP